MLANSSTAIYPTLQTLGIIETVAAVTAKTFFKHVHFPKTTKLAKDSVNKRFIYLDKEPACRMKKEITVERILSLKIKNLIPRLV